MQSLLFVPGSRPERFAKALASGADCVVLDLEDAVPPEGKDTARDTVLAAIGTDSRFAVRINGLKTRAGLTDLLAIAAAPNRPSIVLIPMVDDAAEVAIAREVLGDPAIRLIPMVETVRGLGNAEAIASDPACALMMFGGGDFSAQLGVALAWEPLLVARSQLVMACVAAGKGVIDVPCLMLDDPAGLAEECRRAKGLGMTGKAAIHPDQIGAIHIAFRPSAEEIAEAEAAFAAYAEGPGGAIRFRGKMLEAPVMARYRQILELRDRLNA